MDSKDKQLYIERYESRYKQYGYDSRTLGWGKNSKQNLRFKILSEIDDFSELNRSRILDLGCGFADLYSYLKSNGFEGEYTGVDIVPILIEEAKRRFPHLDLRLMDIEEAKLNKSIDYIFASGIFNAKVFAEGGNLGHVERVIHKCFEMSNKGIAVDFLSSYVDYVAEINYHYDPVIIFEMAKRLSKRVTLRHDYLPYEFCIYIYKDDRINSEFNAFESYLSNL